MKSAASIDRLIQLGRQRGVLKPDEILQVLPVDSMNPGELAAAMMRLDEAGIAIDIDPAFLTPRHPSVNLNDVPETVSLRSADREPTIDYRLAKLAMSINAARGNLAPSRGSVSYYAKMSSVILIAALALILCFLAYWRLN